MSSVLLMYTQDYHGAGHTRLQQNNGKYICLMFIPITLTFFYLLIIFYLAVKYRFIIFYLAAKYFFINPLTAGAAYIRVFIFYEHIKYHVLNMLKIKCDINQQDFKS